MRNCYALAVFLSIVGRLSGADDSGRVEPTIGRFPAAKYAHFVWNPTLRGYFIASPFIMPSRDGLYLPWKPISRILIEAWLRESARTTFH